MAPTKNQIKKRILSQLNHVKKLYAKDKHVIILELRYRIERDTLAWVLELFE